MDDNKIVELFWERDEEAIRATSLKYGKLCFHIASNILASKEDSEECVNDTYLGAWNTIPPQRPRYFSVFISKITRNLALKRCEYLSAAKRNPNALSSLDELDDCISGREYVENELENRRIEKAINNFLDGLDKEKRGIFLCRYWYFESIESICRRTGFSQSKVKSSLFNMRKNLRAYLEREGIEL